MNATLRQPSRERRVGDRLRRRASASVSISRDFEMSQFWQNLQPRLQPAVPNESTGRPGQEVVQRLLLDRVDAEAARPPVRREDDLAALARAHEAEARAAPRAAGTRAGRRRTGRARRRGGASTASDVSSHLHDAPCEGTPDRQSVRDGGRRAPARSRAGGPPARRRDPAHDRARGSDRDRSRRRARWMRSTSSAGTARTTRC